MGKDNFTKYTLIEAEDFCEFCRRYTRDVVGNRLTEERLEFVYHFVFPPSHAELLPVRESKKERSAYEALSNEFGDGPTPSFGPKRFEESGEALERTA